MKNFTGEIVIRPKDETKVKEIGECIHRQLIDNSDYINNNIGINIDNGEVFIWIDDCENQIPDILITDDINNV